MNLSTTTSHANSWKPLSSEKLNEIKTIFADLFPQIEYGDLAQQITAYWIKKLEKVWASKPDSIKTKDLSYNPGDPLFRIRQKTVVIAYADSIYTEGEKTLVTLDNFLKNHFPAVGGLHLLPACEVNEDRFNDGYFSQVVRDRIHPAFGTNRQFADMMANYFSMADFVLNHVDIDHPIFLDYLNGNDAAGDCFFVFSEEAYQRRLSDGDFDQIFRPRPFPLFTIFRRKPENGRYVKMPLDEKLAEMGKRLDGTKVPVPIIGLLSVFNKIKNDQMLLDVDYNHIARFREHLEQKTDIDPDTIFTLSETQETRHPPYIFTNTIKTRKELLLAVGYDKKTAECFSDLYEENDADIFGQEIRALTTFSHVQVDLNTSTYAGLKLLADDFSWYLSLDLNMLRLDAANFAFKRWKTPSFGLPEVTKLMKILYLSMESVSPRIVANLEVNDKLSAVLAQMADKEAPPPMMYDFHLASLMPVIFNTGNPAIASRIFSLINRYDIPAQSIRFSVAESHDGKSVRGSLDLLTPSERQQLADVIEANGGKIKYKGVPPRQYPANEFSDICQGAGLDEESARTRLFVTPQTGTQPLILKNNIDNEAGVAGALNMTPQEMEPNDTLRFFINQIIHGREPYELCSSTRDALKKMDDPGYEADRYLAFYTMAFALMGRNVKSIYFNDLMGLANDYARMERTGELRDIKRTKSDYSDLIQKMEQADSIHGQIAKGINNIIALVGADPALHFRGNEAEVLPTNNEAVAVIHNCAGEHHSLVVINTSHKPQQMDMDISILQKPGDNTLFDNIGENPLSTDEDGRMNIELKPFERLWLSGMRIDVPDDKKVNLRG